MSETRSLEAYIEAAKTQRHLRASVVFDVLKILNCTVVVSVPVEPAPRKSSSGART